MLRRTRRPTTADTVRFCEACSQVSTAADRAERRYADNRHNALVTLGVLR